MQRMKRRRWMAWVAAILFALAFPSGAPAEDTRPPKPAAPKARPAVPAKRAPAAKPQPKISGTPDAAYRARQEAACVRYRMVWGIDCPTENGSGAGGVDPLRDVRRLPLQGPAGK
jgi:hypothetical protein